MSQTNEFELPGDEAIVGQEGDRRIIEAVRKKDLLSLLASWEPMEEAFPEIADEPITPEDVF